MSVLYFKVSMPALVYSINCKCFSEQALGEHSFPVPTAVDCNRHCVIMSLVHGYPLYVLTTSSPLDTIRIFS